MAKWNDEQEISNQTANCISAPELRNYNSFATDVLDKTVYSSQENLQANMEIPNFALLQRNLNNCLRIIDDEVMKGYLTKLEELEVRALDEECLTSLKPIQFFKVTGLVYQEGEFSLHKLATIFHTLGSKPCTLVLMIKSDGRTNDFYLGVRSGFEGRSSGTMKEMLKRTLLGLFPGSNVEEYYNESLEADMAGIRFDALSCATCVADMRQDSEMLDNDKFTQGIEKFVSSMQGQSYHAIFVADSVSYDYLMQIRRDYENICTQLTPFANMQINFTLNNSSSNSEGTTDGKALTGSYTANMAFSANTNVNGTQSITDNVGQSFTKTEGTSETIADGKSITQSRTHGKSKSLNVVLFSDSKNHSESNSNTISRTLSHGLNNSSSIGKNVGTSKGTSIGIATGTGQTIGAGYTTGDSVSFATTKTLTDTFGSSQGITLNARNLSIQTMVNRLEKQLARIEECESLGMWNFAAYFVGNGVAETESAANVYRSIVSGIDSGVECSAVNTWADEEKLALLKPYIKHFLHPGFIYRGFDYEGERYRNVTPAILVSTNELTLHMGLPYRSVKGLPVVEHAVFAQEVLSKSVEARKIELGTIYHLGDETETEVNLDLYSLVMHTFVTGSTGAGKSNTVYHMLSEVHKHKINFLVVEPAKGEYHLVFPEANYYGTNPKLGDILQLNPFAFPDGIHVLEHIDRLVEIFNVCWPMEAAMPAVLKESIEQAYIMKGWDMDASVNIYGSNKFPSFKDVHVALEETIKSTAYSSEVQGNYIGSLGTRLKSLTNGINGRIFAKQDVSLAKIFDETAIIDLSRIGSMETKALMAGVVVLKLQEYRMAMADGMNSPLKHLTVLEEAHNLLKKTSTAQSIGSASVQGKSVEMITNMIAEIRTYGEGFVIVDQAPNLLDTAAIRNTNTKVVMRLPEGTDRTITGEAMALSEKQIRELSKLPTGVAAVYQNDWQEAVLCKIKHFVPSTKSNKKDISLYDKENAAVVRLLRRVFRLDENLISPKIKEVQSKVSSGKELTEEEIEQLKIVQEEKNILTRWYNRLNLKPNVQKIFAIAIYEQHLSDDQKILLISNIAKNILRDNSFKGKSRLDYINHIQKIFMRRYDIPRCDELLLTIERFMLDYNLKDRSMEGDYHDIGRSGKSCC